jgi:small ligand-binding sensory domain FIST
MKVSAALSRLDDPRNAGVEAAMEARRTLDGGTPDLAVVFGSPHFSESAGGLIDAVYEAAGPSHSIGCIGEAIVGGRLEIEAEPAVSVLLASWETEVETFRVEWSAGDFLGWPDTEGRFLLICDPFSFPADALLRDVNERQPGTVIAGGMASGGSAVGTSRLFLDGSVLDSGAVGARIPSGLHVVTLVSQGCRPIGRTFTVTKAEGNIIHELAGSPPLQCIRELYAGSEETDRELLSAGLLMGRVIDEYKTDFERGDFLVRGVVGADPETGAIAIGDTVDIGETVQFHVRDALSADDDLQSLLDKTQAELGDSKPEGALLFTCNGRGSRLFSTPNHDASLITSTLDLPALAGFFCAGELGPIGGKNFLHGFTASMALFCEP